MQFSKNLFISIRFRLVFEILVEYNMCKRQIEGALEQILYNSNNNDDDAVHT